MLNTKFKLIHDHFAKISLLNRPSSQSGYYYDHLELISYFMFQYLLIALQFWVIIFPLSYWKVLVATLIETCYLLMEQPERASDSNESEGLIQLAKCWPFLARRDKDQCRSRNKKPFHK